MKTAITVYGQPRRGPAHYGRGPFKVGRRPARLTRRFSPARVQTSGATLQPRGPFRVQGRRASDLEDRIYRMLKRLRWTDDQIEFQVDVLGGRLPGGAVLDFVVWTFGEPMIIEPNGDYWHTQTEQLVQRDKLRRAMIAEAWGRPFHYFVYAQGDILTDEMAYQRLRRDVGRGG